jgi:hypothetical protein
MDFDTPHDELGCALLEMHAVAEETTAPECNPDVTQLSQNAGETALASLAVHIGPVVAPKSEATQQLIAYVNFIAPSRSRYI